jgi:hypothetical protein
MAYKVTKPIAKDGQMIPAGTIVDAESWRNLRALINGRYLVETSEPLSNARKLGSAEPEVGV